MKYSHLAKAGAAATAATLLLTSCSGGGDEGGGGNTAVMYTTNNETAVGVVTDAAAQQDPPLGVEAVTGAVVPLMQRIESEGGENSADLFYSATPEMLEPFSDLFEPYESPEAAALPDELVQPDNLWTVQNTHVVALMVNDDQLGGEDVPDTWEDLADPKWEGQILSGSPTESGTADAALFGAAQVLEDAQLEQLINNLVVTSDTSTLAPQVAQGEYPITLGYESNILPYIEGGQAGIHLIYPEDGTFVSHEAIAVMKQAGDPDAAKRLADTILSEETQIELLQNSYRRPARTDIDPSEYVDIPRIEDINIVEVDRSALETEHEEFIALWNSLQ